MSANLVDGSINGQREEQNEPLVRQADAQLQMRLVDEDARARETLANSYPAGYFR